MEEAIGISVLRATTANTGARLRQNYGYDGYDEAIPMFTNWEEAVADEELTK